MTNEELNRLTELSLEMAVTLPYLLTDGTTFYELNEPVDVLYLIERVNKAKDALIEISTALRNMPRQPIRMDLDDSHFRMDLDDSHFAP